MTLGASVLCWLLIPLSVAHGGTVTVFNGPNEYQKVDDKDNTIDSRPNIVLIMADDMAWGDVGANWPYTLDTPNLDKMAQQGLSQETAHASTPAHNVAMRIKGGRATHLWRLRSVLNSGVSEGDHMAFRVFFLVLSPT
uniref:Sulfatase N-terminal domain-containing protein n=1 Tax=Timema genevievae TaxID=629358 RepID=A0A7R9JVH0_TIMGE|nr:unnamed protein product [Timema genevievae]